VIEYRDYNLLASLQRFTYGTTKGKSERRHIGPKHDLPRTGGMQKICHGKANMRNHLVSAPARGEGPHCISVGLSEVRHHSINHLQWYLSTTRIIKINHLLAVYLLLERGEVRTVGTQIERLHLLRIFFLWFTHYCTRCNLRFAGYVNDGQEYNLTARATARVARTISTCPCNTSRVLYGRPSRSPWPLLNCLTASHPDGSITPAVIKPLLNTVGNIKQMRKVFVMVTIQTVSSPA